MSDTCSLEKEHDQDRHFLQTHEDQEWASSITPAQAAGKRINKALLDKGEQDTPIPSSELNFTMRSYHTKWGQSISF